MTTPIDIGIAMAKKYYNEITDATTSADYSFGNRVHMSTLAVSDYLQR